MQVCCDLHFLSSKLPSYSAHQPAQAMQVHLCMKCMQQTIFTMTPLLSRLSHDSPIVIHDSPIFILTMFLALRASLVGASCGWARPRWFFRDPRYKYHLLGGWLQRFGRNQRFRVLTVRSDTRGSNRVGGLSGTKRGVKMQPQCARASLSIPKCSRPTG